jgi:hypothetical protein
MNDNGKDDLVLETLLETAAELNVDLSETFVRETYALFADYQFSESERNKAVDKLRELLEIEMRLEINQ